MDKKKKSESRQAIKYEDFNKQTLRNLQKNGDVVTDQG